MDLGYFSTEGDHAAVVDDVNNGLLDVAAFASWASLMRRLCVVSASSPVMPLKAF